MWNSPISKSQWVPSQREKRPLPGDPLSIRLNGLRSMMASITCTKLSTTGVRSVCRLELAGEESIQRSLEEKMRESNNKAALDHLGRGSVGEEAVALALYCFLRCPDDYKKTVLRGANTNGDSDSIASIAGSISGARLGAGGIPEEWIARVENTDALASLAERLTCKKDRSCEGVIVSP